MAKHVETAVPRAKAPGLLVAVVAAATAAVIVAGSAAWLSRSADPGGEACSTPTVEELRALARRASVVLDGEVTGSIRLTDGQTTSAGWAMVVAGTLFGTTPRPPVGIWTPLDVDELTQGRHIIFAVPHPDTSSDGRRHAGYDTAGGGAVLRVTDGKLRRVCRGDVSAPVDRSMLEVVLG